MKRSKILTGIVFSTVAILCACATQYTFTVPSLQPGDTITINAPTTTQTPTQTPTTPESSMPIFNVLPPKIEVGVNLEMNERYQRSYYFVDAYKSSEVWSNTFDAQGWPSSPTFTVLFLTSENDFGAPTPKWGGKYLLSFSGAATLTGTNCTVTNLTKFADGTYIADVTVPDNFVGHAILNFTNTSGGTIKDIKLLRPGYPRGTTKIWTDEFLDSIKYATCIRTLDIGKTNTFRDNLNDPIERRESTLRGKRAGADGLLDWKDRPLKTDATWCDIWGVPIEVLVDLANVGKKDLYITFSDLCSGDYISNALLYIKNNLSPELKLYIERSNETWNGLFKQSSDLVDFATKNAATTNPRLDNPVYNQWYYAARAQMYFTYTISNLARLTFGDAAMGSRVRVIYAYQLDSPGYTADALNWALRSYPNPPKYYIYAIAGAPYFGPTNSRATAEVLADESIANLNKRATGENDRLIQFYSIARQNDIAFVGYECGVDNGYEDPAKPFTAAEKTERNRESTLPVMKDVVAAHMRENLTSGMSLVNYFLGATKDSGVFQWGLSRDVRGEFLNGWSPKQRGFNEAATDDARSWNLAPMDKATGYWLKSSNADTNWVYGSGLSATISYTVTVNGIPTPVTVTRVDPIIQFKWINWQIGGAVARKDVLQNEAKDCTITWSGKYIPRYTGSITLECAVDANDNVPEFSVGGVKAAVSTTTASRTITKNFSAGNPEPIKIVYGTNYAGNGVASIRLMQTEPNGQKSLVNMYQLLSQ